MNISQQSRWRGIASLLALGFLTVPAISLGATVGINKYNDVNGDGSPSGDVRLAGWAVSVYTTANVLIGQTTTVANDRVTISDAAISGTVRICETLQPGWHNTRICRGACGQFEGYTPVANPPAGKVCGDVNIGTSPDYTIHFLNQRDGIFRAFKLNDVNGDKKKDAGDSPLQGWTMSVVNPVVSAQTGADGQAQLTSAAILANGTTYRVCEALQPGWEFAYACWGGCGQFEQYTPSVNDSTQVCVDQALTANSGSDWTIFFGNRELGSIVVQKVLGSEGRGTNPTSAPTPFNFTIVNNGGRTGNFSLNLDEKREYIRTLPPDTYTITEDLATLPENWVSRGANCIPLTPPEIENLVAEVTPVPNKVTRPVNGDEWLCRFYNARYPLITVKKEQNLGDKPLKGWEIVVRLGDEVIASGTTGKDGTWSGYLTKVSTDPKATQAEYQVCEKLQSDWVAEGAHYELVGGSISGKAKLSVKGDMACFPLTMGYNEDWEVVLTNKRVFPIPLVGPLGLGLSALGLGLLGMWRVRRKG